MIIWGDIVPVISHIDSVLTNQLAVGKVGIRIDTLLRSGIVSIEEVHPIHVDRSEFGCVYFEVVEEACCFINGSAVGGANECLTIVRETRIDPAVLFRDSHYILDIHVHACSYCCDTRKIATSWVA